MKAQTKSRLLYTVSKKKKGWGWREIERERGRGRFEDRRGRLKDLLGRGRGRRGWWAIAARPGVWCPNTGGANLPHPARSGPSGGLHHRHSSEGRAHKGSPAPDGMEGEGGGAEASAPHGSDPSSTITVQVKFGGRAIAIPVPPDSTVSELKSLLQPLTNVLPRGQKLICKGKVLADAMTLNSLQISEGSKIMLIASQGVHQGDGPITNNASANLKRNVNVRQTPRTTSVTIEKSRSERWGVTGIVALSECQLKVIPEDVWACGLHARVLDVSNNFIEEVPAKISSLTSISKLFLNGNNLSDDSISWESISCLKSLTILNLSQNHLTILPSVLGTLTSLVQLHVVNNKLTVLPDDIGHLNQLQVLKAASNRIHSVPLSIGNCSSLIEVDLSSNFLNYLPETFGSLANLKSLYLRNNALQSLPATLFKMCMQLSTLDLHGTQITNDILRQLEGWEAFDERRRLKHQKQLDFRVGDPGGFDEGADKDNGHS
ncbi:hypothetical protein Taro_042277 [Colocasia esculenta]|uniref:Ubiquitin-like domain-containing protein n=1 Tax=Colocasia esculenta TaxID=4460 RepID=A0A843WP48_COLES|nr:hypothetical protein [Colocasia esculenta]